MMNDMGKITPEVKCYPATPKIKTMNIEWDFQVPSDWTNSSLTNPDEDASLMILRTKMEYVIK